jgi:regulator of replication initiation timing
VPTIDLAPDASVQDDRLRELTERLERERARNAGLEQGISALSERVEALRLENLELRRRLEHQA